MNGAGMMRSGMTQGRWAADGPLALLIGVGAVFALALGFVVARQAPAAVDPFAACETAVTTLAARVGGAGQLLPVAVLGAVLLAAALALVHQLWVTRRVLARVLAGRAPLPARLDDLARAAGIEGRLDLVADATAYVFCYGMLAPRVCLSSALAALLADDELLAVLRHEAHHLRHRDPVKILVGRSVASGLFFLPLAGALRNGYLAAKELCADADATAAGGELPLARALCKLLQADRPSWPAGVLAVGALSPTEARLQQLIDPQVIRPILPSWADWLVSLALVAGIFGFNYGSAMAGQAAAIDTVCAPPVVTGTTTGTTTGNTTGYEPVAVPGPLPSMPQSSPASFYPRRGAPALPYALECDARCLDSHTD